MKASFQPLALAAFAGLLAVTALPLTAQTPSNNSSPAVPSGTEARNNSKDSGGPDQNSSTGPRSEKWRTVFPAARAQNPLAGDDRLWAHPNGQVFTKDGALVGHLSAPDGTPIRLVPASDDFQIRDGSNQVIAAHRPGAGIDSGRTVLIHEQP